MFAPETVEKVLCHLLRFGSSRADAEDLAQEALLIAWRERASLDTTRSLDGWLYGIARNVFRNHARRERRNPIDSIEDPGDATQASPSMGDVLTLQRALQTLPENQQDIVILHELQGHTLKETAELLAIPFDTAKDRLKRARATLEEACGVGIDATMRAEPTTTRRVAKLAVASVLAGVLGTIAKEGAAVAATTTAGSGVLVGKAILVAMLTGGIVIGVVVDRMIARPASHHTTRDGAIAALPADGRAEARALPDATTDTMPDTTIDTMPDPTVDPTPIVDGRVDDDDVGAEAALVDRARAALRTSSPRDALRILDAHARRFPRGQLREERDLLAIDAAVTLGDYARARTQIARFRADYPTSTHLARIAELEAQLE